MKRLRWWQFRWLWEHYVTFRGVLEVRLGDEYDEHGFRVRQSRVGCYLCAYTGGHR